MLAKANRVVSAGDFRAAVRKGRRIGTPHALLYLSKRPATEPTRVGVIVSKSVGNAVTRNLVTRRLRSIGRDVLHARPTGTDLVIRALPGSQGVSWTTLQSEILSGLERSAGSQS
ncbi:MAG: ribonuclease P protein component [Galbitalea sp.]